MPKAQIWDEWNGSGIDTDGETEVNFLPNGFEPQSVAHSTAAEAAVLLTRI